MLNINKEETNLTNKNMQRLVNSTRRHCYLHSEPKKRDILFLTITLANINRFLQFYIILYIQLYFISPSEHGIIAVKNKKN